MQEEQLIRQSVQRQRVVGVADIVLLIDNTGSMQPCIDGLKENITRGFVDQLEGKRTSTQMKVDWRCRVVTYGDVDADWPNWINLSNPFVDDANALKRQINAITLINGGDIEETFLDALYMVMKDTKWRDKCHRFIVAFSDAPTKPRLNPRIIEEHEADDVPHLQQLLIAQRIKLYGVLPEHETYQELFRQMSRCWPVWVGKPGEESVYQGLQNQDFQELLAKIAASVSQSSGQPVPA
ncbi:MAG: VWA domain-containing protein [candidate division KSB1 bacterium]|nr:VWA domain-containing protein [candidate division KSB1 bacterium]